ncbi:hypothetical protein PF005_g18544 [Phytophthora fragariae]|uniref:Uncharacterized protein n=1 Tax=Phytophthora fragariae TaxID=53985 RepID=A0A6A3XQ63_9STRA|nr:hypothetical protein PF005_g18544 [Phytophthora fragariae]KAE9206434.1 hypothetical protein PF002_g20014 [Phytophthora fragariae]
MWMQAGGGHAVVRYDAAVLRQLKVGRQVASSSSSSSSTTSTARPRAGVTAAAWTWTPACAGPTAAALCSFSCRAMSPTSRPRRGQQAGCRCWIQPPSSRCARPSGLGEISRA